MSLEELNLTDDEKALLQQRKSPDLTPRQFMLVTELQTRVFLMGQMEPGPERDALLAESLVMRDEVKAVDMETSSMGQLNALNQKLVSFHMKVVEATKP